MKKLNSLILIQTLSLFSAIQANPNIFEKAVTAIATPFQFQADKLTNLINKTEDPSHEEVSNKENYNIMCKVTLEGRETEKIYYTLASPSENPSESQLKEMCCRQYADRINNAKIASVSILTTQKGPKQNVNPKINTPKKANKVTVAGVAATELAIIGLLGFAGYKFINSKYLKFVINQIKTGKLDEQINQEDKLKQLKENLLNAQSEKDKEKIILEIAKILVSNKNIFNKIKSLISNK